MKKDHLNNPIFITGIERSGSSIIAKIIQSCGVFTGEVTEMQENLNIRKLTSEYLISQRADSRGQYPLPNTTNLYIPNNWRNRIYDVLLKEKYSVDRPWMYKSSRVCQMYPVWNYAFPNAKWIIVRRRTGDIIQSCLKTGFMTAYQLPAVLKAVEAQTEAEGWLWWVHQHEQLFVEMIESGLNCKVIWPERMGTGDFQQVYEMLEWLGISEKQSIVDLVKPLLRIQ